MTGGAVNADDGFAAELYETSCGHEKRWNELPPADQAKWLRARAAMSEAAAGPRDSSYSVPRIYLLLMVATGDLNEQDYQRVYQLLEDKMTCEDVLELLDTVRRPQ